MSAKYNSELDDLQDEITCPVCLEIFTDPQALPCLHTLCLQCVKDVAGTSKTIPCPTCRATAPTKDVKDDFRMTRSIERYQQKTEGRETAKPKTSNNGNMCELCEEKPAVYKCQNCAIFICQTCKRIHIKTSNCQEGHTATLDSLASRSLEELKEWKKALEEQATSEQTSYLKDMNKMEDQRQEALKSIDKQEEEAVQHFRNERMKVNNNTDETKMIRATEHEEYQKQIHERINYITAMQLSDEETIYQLFESIVDELKKELDKLQTTNFTLTEMTINNKEFDKDKAIRVSFSSGSRSSVNQPNAYTASNSKLGMNSLSIQQSHQLPDRVWKMLAFNGELLCLMDNRIDAYNPSTGQYKRTLPALLHLARSMAITSRMQLLIVALGKIRLIKYNLGRKRGQCISKDVHWDVTSVGGGAVALRVTGGVLHIDQYDSQLQRIKQTATPVTEDKRFTCAVARGSLYLSSECRHCIYRVDLKTGMIVQSFGCLGETQTGHLNNSIISCTDGRFLLIADMGNRRLQTLDSKMKEWKVLTIEGLSNPRAAVVDNDGTLFVAGVRPDTLYVIK